MKIQPMVIDLFHGDVVTDFAAAKQFGIRGVVHKASEGATFTDPLYGARRTAATGAGLLWGAYHYLRAGDPVAQAATFLKAAAPDTKTLLAVDYEDVRVSLTDAIRFIEAAEDKAGRQLVIYSGRLIKVQILMATRADSAFLAARRLWLAHYSAKPTWPPAWRSPWLWQFTGDGEGPDPHEVPGITGAIDVDSYAGTADQLAAEWAGTPIAPPPVAA